MILRRNFFPWPSSSIRRTRSSGRLFFLPLIGLHRLLDGARDKVSSRIATFLWLARITLRWPQLFPEFRVQQKWDSVHSGGRADEVSDEWDWKIAAAGGFDLALRTVRGGVRRPHRSDSRSEHPRCEGQHLGVEARAAAKRCGPAHCRVARRTLVAIKLP